MPWYTGVLFRAERFLASWHKSQQEASRLREVNRAAEALLANQKRGNTEEGCRERKGKRRRGACSSERNDLITVSSTWELTPVGTRYS